MYALDILAKSNITVYASMSYMLCVTNVLVSGDNLLILYVYIKFVDNKRLSVICTWINLFIFPWMTL